MIAKSAPLELERFTRPSKSDVYEFINMSVAKMLM